MPPGRTSPEHTPQKKKENPLGLLLPEKLKKLDAAMDAIRKKYGKNAIHKGELTDFSDR